MADHFLLKSSHPAETCLVVNGQPALAAYSQLQDILTRQIGPEAARLFAEPFLSRDRTGQTINLAWYGPQGGTVRPLSDLDPVARRLAEDRLHIALPRVEALAQDAFVAPLIRAALSVHAPEDILTVDGFPILVNWGVASRSGSNPLDGFLRGSAPQSDAHPNPAADMTARPPVQPPSGSADAGPSTAALEGMSMTPPPAAAPAGLPRIAWVPLVVLLGLVTLTLVWVLWPGTRIFPPANADLIQPATIDAASQAELDGLRARRDNLQAALKGAQCRPDGQLVLPGNVSPEGLQVPKPGAAEADMAQPVAPDAPVAPAPDRVSVPVSPQDGVTPDGAAQDQTATLLDTVESATVLIIAETGDGISTGSGFVVGPGLIVTNLHVVEGALPDSIYVTNKRLGRAEQAKVLKSEGPFEAVGRDFALLQIVSQDLPALILANPAASQKLHHVVAAGFPGDVMETDAGFNRLIQGDASGIPDLVVVDGTINANQEMPHEAQVLVHSAPLSSGNSGGPLVDFCGRVLGVNTFVRQGPMRTLNFAISTATLARFLDGTTVQSNVQTSDCTPQVTPVSPAPPAATPTEPSPAEATPQSAPEDPAAAPAAPADGTAKVAP